jgi:hypothetical protein
MPPQEQHEVIEKFFSSAKLVAAAQIIARGIRDEDKGALVRTWYALP